jgi:hypothetical protein
VGKPSLYAGGSLQVIQGRKMIENVPNFPEK